MGLLGMRERALALGGEVRITGARGRGTRILVILPDSDSAAAYKPVRAAGSARAHA
jgi:glucose-6-phosphate-specific signal transduction histidine kinase